MSSPNDPTPGQNACRRTTLQGELIASHLAFATAIVLAFGATLFAMTLRAAYRQAEADLLGAAQLLVKELAASGDAPSLAVSDAYFHRFGPAPRDRAYVAVWDANGRRIAGTEPAPPEVAPAPKRPATDGPHPFFSRSYGTHLDVIVATPTGGQLLIGRPLAKEFDAIWRLLGQLLAAAAICLAVGFVGARWLAQRLARPLVQMADAAERIDGRHLGERLNVAAGPEETGRLAMVFNSMLDRLHEAFERQTRFTADASHELRTPTAVVLLQTDHALARERSPDEYRLALQTCRQAAQRMKRLVDDLLLLARADSGRLELRTAPVDLADVARETVELLQPLAAQRNVRIELHADSAPLSGDAGRLGQAVANLVTNSVNYNAAGGSVTVSTSRAGNSVVLVVQDDGPGIPIADQPRLFERFYRVDQARTLDENAGVGLGLSVVAEIFAAHRGTIHLASTPGAGTTVTVRFPAQADRVAGRDDAVTPA